MGVSLNGGTPKSCTLIGFSIINHPFWGTTISGNPHIYSRDPSISKEGTESATEHPEISLAGRDGSWDKPEESRPQFFGLEVLYKILNT